MIKRTGPVIAGSFFVPFLQNKAMAEDNFWDQFKDDDIPFEKRERKEWVEPDPLTGGTQKVVTIGKSFMMVIPDRAIQLSPEEAEAFRARLGVYRSTGPNTGIWECGKKDL